MSACVNVFTRPGVTSRRRVNRRKMTPSRSTHLTWPRWWSGPQTTESRGGPGTDETRRRGFWRFCRVVPAASFSSRRSPVGPRVMPARGLVGDDDLGRIDLELGHEAGAPRAWTSGRWLSGVEGSGAGFSGFGDHSPPVAVQPRPGPGLVFGVLGHSGRPMDFIGVPRCLLSATRRVPRGHEVS